jgi:hypothetical protein
MADATIHNSEIYEASIAAARNIIYELIPLRDGRTPYFPDVVSTPDIFRDEVVKLGAEHVPACGIRLETMRAYAESRNKQALTHVHGYRRTPDRTRTVHNLACVQSDMNVYYYDDDFTSATQFCKNWIHQLQYRIDLMNEDIGVGCHLALGDSITIPERNFAQAGNLYSIESGIILTSFVGTMKRVSEIKQVNASVNLLINNTQPNYTRTGYGPPTFSANGVGVNYWDKLNAVGYTAISIGLGEADWITVAPPGTITDWRVSITKAGDGTLRIRRT